MSKEETELVPMGSLPPGMPTARELGATLAEQLGQHIAQTREERGSVHAAEDTFPLVRSLVASQELLSDYAQAFASVAKVATQELESELLDAAGEQDGMPLGSITVPDKDGDILLRPDTRNDYDIDATTLRAVLVALVADLDQPEQAADLALGKLLELGLFTPQVSKVKAFAAELSRSGNDGMASVVTGAIRKAQQYKGVKAGRK